MGTLLLGGCSSSSAPSPQAPAVEPAAVVSFRDQLARERTSLGDQDPTPLLEKTLSCLTDTQRTPGDRYVCVSTLLDPALRVEGTPDDLKRRIAFSLYLALDGAAATSPTELRLLGTLTASILARFELARLLDGSARRRLVQLLEETDAKDDLFRAQAVVRKAGARALTESEDRP